MSLYPLVEAFVIIVTWEFSKWFWGKVINFVRDKL